MNIIDRFIAQYNKEFDYYQKVSQIIASQIEDELIKRGIKAIVTSRAKKPDRLKDKLSKRNIDKKYKSVEEIYEDIVDLAGIRVALYFPSDRDILEEIIDDLFHVKKTKKFPNETHKPKYTKRFSGYWATHYRVKIKQTGVYERYSDTIAEVQIASVLMHAWSEVEHDLVYKPFSGDLSKEELAILDEINGLVLSGEIALERLQSAMANRTKEKKTITDKYELTNYLLSKINTIYDNKIKIGDNFLLNNYLNSTDKIDLVILEELLKHLDISTQESVTDQLLNSLIDLSADSSTNFKTYFKNLHFSDRSASSFEKFVKCWVILEKSIRQIYNEGEIKTTKHLIPDFQTLKDRQILNDNEIGELISIKRIRNNLLHGIETPSNSLLAERFERLKEITKKVIDQITEEPAKSELENDLAKLR